MHGTARVGDDADVIFHGSEEVGRTRATFDGDRVLGCGAPIVGASSTRPGSNATATRSTSRAGCTRLLSRVGWEEGAGGSGICGHAMAYRYQQP